VRTRGGYDKPPCTRRALQVDRTVGRQGIIAKSNGEGTMNARGGESDGTPVMGQRSARTKASQGGVGYYGKCRRQREAVQQHKKGRKERGNGYGWRHNGRYAVNALGMSGDKGEKVETRARDKAEREQKRGRPHVPKTKCKITKRRMRMNATIESRGGRPSGTEGNTVDS